MSGRPGDAAKIFFVPVNFCPVLKKDLAFAGIPYETKDGYLDVHSLRHTTGKLLAEHNVAPKVAMAIMAHSDIKMTLDNYVQLSPDFVAAELAKLPVPKAAGFLGRLAW